MTTWRQNIIAYGVLAFVVVALIGVAMDRKGIGDFDECVAAGNPPTEGIPRTCTVPGGQTFTEDIGNTLVKQDLIRLAEPRPNAEIKSPLTITGEARGTWFFEASFPVQLLLGDGRVLAEAPAQAEGEWMTENFVPFRATLTFEVPVTASRKGTLVLKKDNPSGLPEHDDELRIPVSFPPLTVTVASPSAGSSPVVMAEGNRMPQEPAPAMARVKAFFTNSRLDPGEDCKAVFPVERIIPQTPGIGRAALNELLKGPDAVETETGYATTINPGVTVQGLTIRDGVARVDFGEELERAVGGSCRVAAIRAQITETLKQFPTVREVIISIGGRTEDILQP